MLRKIIFGMAVVCSSMIAYSMDYVKDPHQAIIPSTTNTVGSFLLLHKTDLFNHDMICSLVINKEWEDIVKGVAPKLRAHFTTKIPQYLLDAGDGIIIWHKYGTARGRKYVTTSDNEEYPFSVEHKRVTFTLDSVYWEHGDVKIYLSDSLYGSKEKTKDIVRPEFNKDGDFCCYSMDENPALWNKFEHVVEYRLSKNTLLHSLYSPVQILRCGLKLKNETFSNYALSHFLSFPALLYCFLNSKVVKEITDFGKLYSLKDAIIPHNYKECVPYEYRSFKELPKELRKEITEHYKQQQLQNNQLVPKTAPKKRRKVRKNIFWR